MADKPLSHEDIEKWVQQQPLDVIRRLPDSVESREAVRLIEITTDLAHHALEKVKPA